MNNNYQPTERGLGDFQYTLKYFDGGSKSLDKNKATSNKHNNWAEIWESE